MSKRFRGKITLDARDAIPDWSPYEAPRPPEGAPNVLYIVWDDVGYGAFDLYGGLIEVPAMRRIAERGLRYSQFHTTALCSPTRSCLLNGRNATSNGMACITEGATGFPGSNARIPFENALISEVLVEHGWSTFCLGKWHLTPQEEENLSSTKIRWPLGRGFERFYGYLGGETDQWYPNLVYDNHPVEPPATPNEGYHLSKDLADKAIEFIADARAIAPDKPWLMYFCPGAGHAPHHVWPEWADKYKGKFDMGYDRYREQVLANQKKLGLVPEETQLPPLNPYADMRGPDGEPWPIAETVRPWDTLSPDEKRLFARMAEVYAGFLSYTDAQIGRILDFLEETGQLDNTLIVALSDNGASAEGSPNGSVNEMKFFNGVPDTIETNMKYLDVLGSEQTYNHYPTGWAMAFNTPFKLWKRFVSHEGGTADPLIISWPRGIKDQGVVRNQYIHAIDVVPTLYDCLGVTPPEVVKGYVQTPLEGVSFKHTFADGNAPTAKEAQFYTMLGTRGIWYQGWQANTIHPAMPSGWGHFAKDTWELFHLEQDRNQLRNVAEQYPERLEQMKAMWYVLAGKYHGLPLDDRSAVELFQTPRPRPTAPRAQYVYFPGAAGVPDGVAAPLFGRSFNIVAEVYLEGEHAQGVLFSQGRRIGGHALFVQDGRLHYVYNWLGEKIQRVSSSRVVPAGHHLLGVRYRVDGQEGASPVGQAALYIDDQPVGEARLITQASLFGIDSMLTVGRSGTPAVTTDYQPPYAFAGGSIKRVLVDVSGERYRDLERELAAMLLQD